MTLEKFAVAEVPYQLIRLPQYEKDLKKLKKLEPKLHEQVIKVLQEEIEGNQFDEIKGTGGWIKGRVPSPSRKIGKSGGFRAIYLFFRIQRDIYMQTVYDHREKSDLSADEKKELKKASSELKTIYKTQKRGI